MTSANVFDGSAWVEFDSEGDFMAAKKLHKTNMGSLALPFAAFLV